MGVTRPLALLALLVLLAPCTAAARGRNVGGQADQVLLVVTDDVTVCALAGFDCAEPDALATPALDSITAVKVSSTYTAPLCAPTRAEMHSMGFATSTWYAGLVATGGGQAAYDAPWSARMLSAAGVPARLHGKGHFRTDVGYCSDDDAPCFYDETCGAPAVCEFGLPTLEESRILGLLDTGWEFDGMIPANPGDYLSWTSAQGTPDPARNHSFIQAAETTYRDDVTVAEAAAWIEARDPANRWLTVVNLSNAHIPYHLPPGQAGCTGFGSDEECFWPQLDEAYNVALPELLAAVDPARTCVIVMPDNGTQDQVNQTVLRGKKGELWEGGIRVGSHWSSACFGRGVEPDPSVEISHVDVMRFALELVGAYDPTAWDAIPASSAWDPRLAAARPNQTSDLLQSWSRGYCSSGDCRDRTGKLAHLAMDDAGNAVYVLGGYKLLRSFAAALGGGPESLYSLPDELTDLCGGDCAGNLTGPALAAYQAILGQFDRLHGPARPAELSVLSFAHSSGTLTLTDGANDFYVSNARGTDLATDWNLNLTQIVCDLDMGLGLGVERFAAQPTQTLVGSFSSRITITKTYSTPGAYAITGTCFDALEPDDVLAVSGTWTLPSPGGGGGISGDWAVTFDTWAETCAWNTGGGSGTCLSDNGATAFRTVNADGLATGPACLRGGAGDKCLRWNTEGSPSTEGATALLAGWTSGSSGIAPSATQFVSQAWWRFEPGFVYGPPEGGAIKAARAKTGGGADLGRATWKHNNCTEIGQPDFVLADGSSTCSTPDWGYPGDAGGAYVLMEFAIDTVAGTGSVEIFSRAGVSLTKATRNDVPAGDVGQFMSPDYWTPASGVVSSAGEFWIDEACLCAGTPATCGVGSGGACDVDFPD